MEKKTIDKSTAASAPGQLEIDRDAFARYMARNALEARWIRFASKLPWGWREYVPGEWPLQWRRHQEHFWHGDLTPGLILDAAQSLVAVYTNVDARGRIARVIKVMKEKLHLAEGLPLENGQRFAALSVYYRGYDTEKTGRWADFRPIVAECLCRSKEAISGLYGRVTTAEWDYLETGVARLPAGARPGLYPFHMPGEGPPSLPQ